MQKITTARSHRLYSTAAARCIEKAAATSLPPYCLMARAGLAIARLSLAIAPHARCIWIACGPGNNGGDGFEAATHLHQLGKRVVVTWTGTGKSRLILNEKGDAQAARGKALAAGVIFSDQPPPDFDFCVDALLGIGANLEPDRESTPLILQWLHAMMASNAPCLAVDVPSGLNADTGEQTAIISGAACAHKIGASRLFTLCLLTLKPGLFTCDGRDNAGEIWFDGLGVDAPAIQTQASPNQSGHLHTAWLFGADRAAPPLRSTASHSSHKGSFGDVAVVGGESTATSHMEGAALLAASAALHAGAGRVFVTFLGNPALTVDTTRPELMFRNLNELDLSSQVVVCGCGGGKAVDAVLPQVLVSATRLVLDADALNGVAGNAQLQTLLKARAARNLATVLTPHPLEAARLLQTTTAHVQSDRLAAAAQLAAMYDLVVVLKGSGSVTAAPGQTSCINPSGNALLSTAGTGDVLAGVLAAYLTSGLTAFEAACSAVFAHGRAADNWLITHPGQALTASALARSI